jgi:hypothetical protein
LLGHREIATTQVYSHIVDSKKVDAVNQLPVLPDRIEGRTLPSSTAKGSIQRALEAEGEKIARALRLQQDGQGRYLFEGKAFTAAELAIEASQGEQ